MEPVLALTTHLLAGLGQAGLVIILFSVVSRVTRQQKHSQIWYGVLFGVGAVASMMHPIPFAPGIVIDPRTVMLALAGPFGGPVAAVVSMLIAGAMRIYIGGMGLGAGLLGIAIAGAAGLVHRRMFNGRTDVRALAFLGLMATAFLASVALLPAEIAVSVLKRTGPWLVLVNFTGIVAIGTLLSQELRFQQKYVSMKTQASLDPLTKLANRRALDAVEASLMEGMHERDEGYAVVMFDIDHFKSVNDNWGHEAGDHVLQRAAEEISACMRRSDFAVRYGGEELLLVLRGAGADGAFGLAETIRRRIEEARFEYNGNCIKVTVSAGVATGKRNDLSLASAIRRADEALYQAKSKGRNRSEVYYRLRETA